jgi:hypothetical protein
MKKNVFHRELLAFLGLATGKAKRAAKILTSTQQQTLHHRSVLIWHMTDWFSTACCLYGARPNTTSPRRYF